MFVCVSLSAQTYQGNGEIQWNFLKGGSMAHSLSTDQLVVKYQADQDLLQLMVKPMAFSKDGSSLDKEILTEVLQAPANRLMVLTIRPAGINEAIIGQSTKSLAAEVNLRYNSQALDFPAILTIKPQTEGFELGLEMMSSLTELGLPLQSSYQELLSESLQIMVPGVSLEAI